MRAIYKRCHDLNLMVRAVGNAAPAILARVLAQTPFTFHLQKHLLTLSQFFS
jgi:hypothetical protein